MLSGPPGARVQWPAARRTTASLNRTAGRAIPPSHSFVRHSSHLEARRSSNAVGARGDSASPPDSPKPNQLLLVPQGPHRDLEASATRRRFSSAAPPSPVPPQLDFCRCAPLVSLSSPHCRWTRDPPTAPPAATSGPWAQAGRTH
ncbi:hypothetical protein NDU88_004764 [Pleurodeles waltl]|uniref:Uncharacterized protein n=1 Tax=Pleurodeles waltl TaxID=8319 RepID=A0AAV7MHI4_PLEWA|nr:hypothetical protein NDU88_004764 [Pleurodeles waltl]